MDNYYYILDENLEPVVVDDALRWGEWFQNADRHLAKTTIEGIDVSTVFLGLNHDFMGEGSPILWETMIFDTENQEPLFDEYQERYASFDEARAGHERAVAFVKVSLNLNTRGR